MGKQIAAFSGGKDSTAMVLRLAEIGEDFECLFTPTGNELPELIAHIRGIVERINRPLVLPPNKTLDFWINEFNALPNNRQRWCTRLIKIVPCISYLEANPGSTLLVGLRADEETRQGLYGSYAAYRYPLREWNWSIGDVWHYCRQQAVKVPSRTDCALCYDQRVGEWYHLWLEHPAEYAKGEAFEAATGHTFRSPSRDTWPASLAELRIEFESGRKPQSVLMEERQAAEAVHRAAQLPLFDAIRCDDEAEEYSRCRVCRL